MTPEERVLESWYDRLTAYPVDKSRVIVIEFQSWDLLWRRGSPTPLPTPICACSRACGRSRPKRRRPMAGRRDRQAARQGCRCRGQGRGVPLPYQPARRHQQHDAQQPAARRAQLAGRHRAGPEGGCRDQGEDHPRHAAQGRIDRGLDIVVRARIRTGVLKQRGTLRAQLAEQSSQLLDGHPRIKELKAQIGDLDKQIRAEAEKLVRTLENEARIAGARVDASSANLDMVKRQAASTNEQDVQLRALEREAKAQRDLLESYLG
jgi:hypothetical protein